MKRNFTIEEVQQLRNFNIELMEAVTHVAVHIIRYAEKNKIPLPDGSELMNLLAHARKVIQEINEEITFSQTHNYKSRKLPHFNFDEDNPDKLPEPKNYSFINTRYNRKHSKW